MKSVKVLLFLSFSILLFSCNDDDEDIKLELGSLKQTSWKGTFFVGEQYGKQSVGLVFYTDSTGYYDLVDVNNPNDYPDNGNFKYTINEKILQIGEGTLYGSWLLIKKTHDTMVLEKGTSGDLGKRYTMNLEKVH